MEYDEMIYGIGIDTIEIERFSLWHTYSRKKLSRIFSPQEIDYCLENPCKSAERFAVRFAAREAFFKALSYACSDFSLPFLTLCARVAITKIDTRPQLVIRDDIGIEDKKFIFHLSFSHNRSCATAFVVVER